MGKPTGAFVGQRPLLFGIMLAVLVWGTWLAIGALRAFQSRGDWRQGAIIYACTLGFLAFWLAMLWGYPRRSRSNSPTDQTTTGWSRGGVASTTLAILAVIPFGLTCQAVTAERMGVVLPNLGATVGLLGAALVMSLVGLSHPGHQKGKFLSWSPMLMIVGMVTVWYSLVT